MKHKAVKQRIKIISFYKSYGLKVTLYRYNNAFRW